MLTRWFYKRNELISKHKHHLTKYVDKKIDRRTGKGQTFAVYSVSDGRLLIRDGLSHVESTNEIKAGFHVGKEPHTLTDLMYTTGAWREAYQKSINSIDVPEDALSIPEDVKKVKVLPSDTRRSVERKRKHGYETVEDKIRSSQTSQKKQPRKCSRCGISGHNIATCEILI
ncbi:hypothetical protein YC2023_060794 [Brassica napus]|uniref:Uncharacterized protein n=1 Tax=Brassica oleracea TaxID=3712 RepID=A0A3P6EKH9_BRAOL|nr:unnamed protein product [Brassica oleracea]